MLEKEPHIQKEHKVRKLLIAQESLEVAEPLSALLNSEHELNPEFQTDMVIFQRPLRERILEELSKELSGSIIRQSELAKKLGVTRQAINYHMPGLKAQDQDLPLSNREYLHKNKAEKALTRIDKQRTKKQERATFIIEVERLRFEQKLSVREIAERLDRSERNINYLLWKLNSTNSTQGLKKKPRTHEEIVTFDELVKPLYNEHLTYKQITGRLNSTNTLVMSSLRRLESRGELTHHKIRRKPRTQEEIVLFDELVKPLFDANLTYDQIAEKLDSTNALVTRSVQRLESRGELSFRCPRIRIEEIEGVRRLRKENKLRNKEIAEILDIPLQRVSGIIKKLNKTGDHTSLKDTRNL